MLVPARLPLALDRAVRTVARPRASGQVGSGAARKPGHRALPVVQQPSWLPAAQDSYHTATA